MVVKSRKNHTRIISRMPRLIRAAICILILTGCASYKPYAVDEVPFRVVLWISSELKNFEEVELMNWEIPPER